MFADEAAIAEAGWSSQEASDLLAVIGPRLVGIAANRIPKFLRTQGGRRFSQWQADDNAHRRRPTRAATRRHRQATQTAKRPHTATGEAG